MSHLDPPDYEPAIHPAEEEILCILEGEIGEAEKQKVLDLLTQIQDDATREINRLSSSLDSAQLRLETAAAELEDLRGMFEISKRIDPDRVTHKGQFGSTETHVTFWEVATFEDEEWYYQITGYKCTEGETYEDCLRNIRDGKARWVDSANERRQQEMDAAKKRAAELRKP